MLMEMHYDFLFKVNRVDSVNKENWIPAEIDWALNYAIETFVKQRTGTSNNKQLGFEAIQKRIDDLKTLVIKSPTTQQAGLTPTLVSTGMYEVELSNLSFPYLFYLRGQADIVKSGCSSRTAKMVQVQHDDLSEAGSFHGPNWTWGIIPIVFGRSDNVADGEGSIYLYTDNLFTISTVYVEYLKRPNKVCIGTYTYLDGTTPALTECDLPEHTHSEVVDMAVADISKIIQDPEFAQLRERRLVLHE